MQNETIKNSGHKQHKSSSLDLELLHSPTTTSSQLGKKKELVHTPLGLFFFVAQKLLQLLPTAAQ
jgi:hypothetical protein